MYLLKIFAVLVLKTEFQIFLLDFHSIFIEYTNKDHSFVIVCSDYTCTVLVQEYMSPI